MAGTRTGTRLGYACDGCRRQKVKCSGSQPCTKCSHSKIACVYGKDIGRSSASYVKHLEARIAELEAQLQGQTRVVKASEDAGGKEHVTPDSSPSEPTARDGLVDTLIGSEDDYVVVADQNHGSIYHGHFGGLTVLRSVRNLCYSAENDSQDLRDGLSGASLVEAFDSPYLVLPERHHVADYAPLPPVQRLTDTINTALDRALTCQECIERGELWYQIDALHQRNWETYTRADRSMLALVYALLALGRRYESGGPVPSQQGRTVLKGLSYYRSSRAILDAQGSDDIYSIVAICCLASYLMSCNMVSKAHACITVGVSAALRMGLHVSASTSATSLSSEELTRRRRVLAVLNINSVMIESVLGMPHMLRDAEQSQLLPVPEEDAADEGRRFLDANPLSPFSATVYSAKLYRILGNVIASRSGSPVTFDKSSGTYVLDFEATARFAAEIEEWHDGLPKELPEQADERMLRQQMFHRLQHAAVQYSLYRSFLRHVCRDKTKEDFSYQGYSYGSSCLRAATQMILCVENMFQRGTLHEAQWYAIYALALAASSLMSFVMNNKDAPTVDESCDAARRAVELLRGLSRTSSSARRCFESLVSVVSLPQGEWTSEREPEPASPRARFFEAIGAQGTHLSR